ncbi:MAG: cytochrome c3 family protein [Candidatus Zixiibacteriota bacterium]|nr:MAG: cytochrome c3 family protein [candidate division Zixibacteria bacterium]
MAQIFPEWTNKLPPFIALGAIIIVIGVIGFVWYYFSPWYTDVGYRPVQPVPFSHKLHNDDLGIDCRFCHNLVEVSPHANVPPTQTCMNCHKLIKPDSEKLAKIGESWEMKKPMQWIRIHKLPDFAYFDHSVHLRAGVGCASCHGNINQLEVVRQNTPLSMSWCLDCHRNPDMHLRPVSEITNMYWTPPDNQMELAKIIRGDKDINPKTDCSACHR